VEKELGFPLWDPTPPWCVDSDEPPDTDEKPIVSSSRKENWEMAEQQRQKRREAFLWVENLGTRLLRQHGPSRCSRRSCQFMLLNTPLHLHFPQLRDPRRVDVSERPASSPSLFEPLPVLFAERAAVPHLLLGSCPTAVARFIVSIIVRFPIFYTEFSPSRQGRAASESRWAAGPMPPTLREHRASLHLTQPEQEPARHLLTFLEARTS
jgi:hypothetical protein